MSFEQQYEVPEEELPFRPYTMDEVSKITGIYTSALEAWLKTTLELFLGDDRETRGLDHMQCFAVYCGRRFLDEGAGPALATKIVRFVAGLTERGMMVEFKKGNTFPCVADGYPKMLTNPKPSKLVNTLNLRTLYKEFRHHLKRVFPK